MLIVSVMSVYPGVMLTVGVMIAPVIASVKVFASKK